MKRTADRLFGEQYHWSVLGAGRSQMPVAAQSAAMGGNVRVGLEDSLWIGPGRLAATNAEQVSKVRGIIEELGCRARRSRRRAAAPGTQGPGARRVLVFSRELEDSSRSAVPGQADAGDAAADRACAATTSRVGRRPAPFRGRLGRSVARWGGRRRSALFEHSREGLPALARQACVRGREPRSQLDRRLALAFGDLAHDEDRLRVEGVAAGEGEVAETRDRDVRVLVQPEDVLDRDEPPDQGLAPFRVERGEELERVAEALAADPEPVVVGRRRAGADPVALPANRPETALDQIRGERDGRLRGRARAGRVAGSQRAAEAADEGLVAAGVEQLQQLDPRGSPLVVEQRPQRRERACDPARRPRRASRRAARSARRGRGRRRASGRPSRGPRAP